MKQIYISVNLSKPKKTNKNQQIEIILKIQRDLVSKTVISCYKFQEYYRETRKSVSTIITKKTKIQRNQVEYSKELIYVGVSKR